MDYRNYGALMERYSKLAMASVAPDETKESLIKRLTDISYQKKEILLGTNAIIRDYIVKYEKDPSLLDAEAVAMLRDFLNLLMPTNGSHSYVDPCISLRICKLLLGYYQAEQNLDQIVQMVCWCTTFDLMVKEHQDANESSPYCLLAGQYLKDFDKLSDQKKHALVNCWLISVYNLKDLTFGLRHYREIQRQFEELRQKMGEDFQLHQYTACKTYVLGFAMGAWHKAEYAPPGDAASAATLEYLQNERGLIQELADELKALLLSDKACELFPDRVTTWYYLAQADYYLGRITMQELLSRAEALTHPQEDYRALEQCSSLFWLNVCYLDYLCKSRTLDKQTMLDKTLEVIAHVRKNSADAIKGLSELSQYISVYQSNRYMLELISAASNIVDFHYFKRIVLDSTVYVNKELYVHTMTVKEICLVLLGAILDQSPQYLDGVAGKRWTYWRDHKEEALSLMENSALFHDIGKYYCLDFVTNSSRNLTDEEFEIIKEHPLNFSTIYQGEMNPEIECIRDCAQLHHLWYDETGGYPRMKHTANKPFVNILTISDCIDAATDDIGRPYGLGKTLEQLMGEFDSARDTRYCGYICELLHSDAIQSKIKHVINERRKEIYCDIYFAAP